MNAIINKIQLLYCDICDKTIKIKSESKHLNSKSHQHKENYGIFAKKYELLDQTIRK